jgi:hypothetical protein
LGPLECRGVNPFKPAESCQSLAAENHDKRRFYIISDPLNDFLKVVYCDFSIQPLGDPGYEIDTGVTFPIIEAGDSNHIAFDAYRKSTYTNSCPSVIPYEAFLLVSGRGMNLSTGVFTAPVAGVYEFTFSWVDFGTSSVTTELRVNSIAVARLYSGPNDTQSVQRYFIAKLEARDTVDTYLSTAGSLVDYPDQRFTRFTGHMMI